MDVELSTEMGKEGLDGTQKAPMLWQNTLRRYLETLNCERHPADPSVFRHVDDMELTIHVDDTTLRG